MGEKQDIKTWTNGLEDLVHNTVAAEHRIIVIQRKDVNGKSIGAINVMKEDNGGKVGYQNWT